MTDLIGIDKGIPVPAVNARKYDVFPLDRLAVGDSFFVKAKDYDKKVIQSAAHYHGKKANRTYVVRSTVDNGVSGTRCWRIK